MRAALVVRPQRFSVAEIETPEPGPGEVRVRVEACGICGTDLHLHHGNLMAAGHTPGHEIVGRVDAVGPAVAGAPELGTRVAVVPLHACGACDECTAGRINLCASLEIHGLHRPGGFAEHVVVQAGCLAPIADDLDAAVAALAEPLAVAVHGLRRVGFEKGQRVVVVGAGAVGLVTVLAARALGAAEVIATARHPHQAALARDLGASRVLLEHDASPDAMSEIGRSGGVDIAVETVGGTADTLRTACRAVRPGGTVCVLGVFMKSPQLDPIELISKEISLCWSNCYNRPGDAHTDFGTAVTLLEDERERLAALVTHQLPLAEIERGYALASDKRAGAVKVTITP